MQIYALSFFHIAWAWGFSYSLVEEKAKAIAILKVYLRFFEKFYLRCLI